MKWPRHPLIYEINTWVWLGELSRKHRRPVSLATVPAGEWDALASLNMDAVWLMGVWERSPAGIAIAMEDDHLQKDFRRALPDLKPEDIVGSPYCVRRYTVDEHLGGNDGLAVARENLAKRNIRLVLDFVPNHVSPDHPWATEHPEHFIRGDSDDLQRNPGSFIQSGSNIYARGRDPYFPAWPDVLQLNAFSSRLREAATKTVTGIASQADGVRCDMAMLLLNKVFAKTWGDRAGSSPAQEYWTEIIEAIRAQFPHFIFVAEAYWDMEWDLQELGFDFCYDKRLYDRIEHERVDSVRSHLCAELSYQEKLVRFIENHDEPRASAVFSSEKHRAAAVLTLSLPGAKLLHEGQMEGYRTRLPVFLSRRPEEPTDYSLQDFYRQLLRALQDDVFHTGQWSLCDCAGWPDNASCQNLIASCWSGDSQMRLIVVNLSDSPSQACVRIPFLDLRGRSCQFQDLLCGQRYERDGNDIVDHGLFVDLKPWGFHFFDVQVGSGTPAGADGSRPRLARKRKEARRTTQTPAIVHAGI